MRICFKQHKLSTRTTLALIIPTVYLLFFIYFFVLLKSKEFNSVLKPDLHHNPFFPSDGNNITVVSNTSIVVFKQRPEENITILFGKVRAKVTSEDEELVFVSVPECEFPVTKWPITVAIKMVTSRYAKVIGHWTYPARYPDDYTLNIPEVNIAITWIPTLTKSQKFVFKQFIKTLDRTWRFQIYTLPNSKNDFMKDDLIREEVENGRVELPTMQEMGYRNWTTSQLSRQYWKGIHGDRILSFQNDVVFCNNPTSKLEDFFDYDIMTSLWVWPELPHMIGNNGFALRKRKVIMDILAWDCPQLKNPVMTKGKTVLDDITLATCVENNKTARIKLPPKWLSRTFCLEAVFYPHPIAVHKPWDLWRFMSNEQKQTLFKNCPFLSKVCHNYEIGKRKEKRFRKCDPDEMINMTLEEVLPLYALED